MSDYYSDDAFEKIPFEPGDNPTPLDSVDWKTRYNELSQKDWDPKDFVGMKRLGHSYHPVEPFFKFEGISYENNTYDRMMFPTVGCALGTLTGAFTNWWSRRPFWSSILPTIALGAVGYGIGVFAWNNSRRRARERDAVLIHYMILHEKEFPRIG